MAGNQLTPREESILKMIQESVRTRGYPPSVREIGQAVGLSSSSTVHNYLRRLETKGYLRRDPTKPRALELLDENRPAALPPLKILPVLGRVAAGMPLLAVENQEEIFPLPVSFTGEGEFFMLTVRGDSMIEAGIFNGDLVVVKRQSAADNGDIVVALLDDEATVKRFFRENDHIRLQPENSAMSPILVKSTIILGKVTGLLRKI
ncbi:transcriptional repressor LexA [Desulfotomaculum copahuensis]|uniref:LexA repressor n=1 Tax=Desulfotomaculum copahuensis TaxID=1838280 RepID=A0A1B7LE57_9FIRM|nr:transcriptional repressor LexA [Desulfotomaculum copahuensis]OAT81383.1 repressor LexA [Desulfotomaculum copahuensis]